MKISNSYPVYFNNIAQPAKHNLMCFKSRNFLDLPESDIFKKIQESVVPENFLGQGTEAEVYKIKNTDYCIRIPYLSNDISRFKYSKEITAADKVNHVVAKLGFGASILKFFDGVIPKWYKNDKISRYKMQEKIADMSVKPYSELLHQIADAIDNEMFFDFTGGNLIVDTEKQKLTAIDFYRVTDNPRPLKPLSEMYQVLTSYGAEEKTGRKIYDKIIEAGLNEFKPGSIPCMDVALFDFADLCIKRKRDCYLPDGEKIISSVMHQTDVLQKIKKAEIRDKTNSKLLEKIICDLKMILKKIH